MSEVEIRPIRDLADFRAVEQLQRDVWRLDDVEIVPDHLLITAQKHGGLVLGAYGHVPGEQPALVGFAFGFVGLTSSGSLKHCSHMVGVAPEWRNQGIGLRLKLAQREHVLGRGLTLMTWTFDPLESRNGRLNFRKLGATCSHYVRDLYGNLRDELNRGLPSDRFEVVWSLTSEHVSERLRWSAEAEGAECRALRRNRLAEGARLVNGFDPSEIPKLPQSVHPMEGERLLIQIPACFQNVRAADMALARAWREHTRKLFEGAFARDYTVVDALFSNGRSYYLLVKGWQPA